MEENQQVPWSEVLKDWADIIWTEIVYKWKFFVGSIRFSIHGPDKAAKNFRPLCTLGPYVTDPDFKKKWGDGIDKEKEQSEDETENEDAKKED